MATIYDEMQDLADELTATAEFGQSGYVRRTPQTGTAYNPSDGTPVNHAATFAVIDYSNRDIDGTRILATDKRVLMGVGTLTITPSPSDLLIEASGGVYKIVRVAPFDPAGTPTHYEIQARR